MCLCEEEGSGCKVKGVFIVVLYVLQVLEGVEEGGSLQKHHGPDLREALLSRYSSRGGQKDRCVNNRMGLLCSRRLITSEVTAVSVLGATN